MGFYDTHLRVAGEDQVLVARLRERGYEVYQAPRLVYHLSVSGGQDTVRKLCVISGSSAGCTRTS